MVIKVNVKYRNSFLSSKSSKLLKLEENYLISWIFISYTFLSMMMWISSLCTWCIIFMYMMYHWRPQSIVLLFIHTFPKTYFSIFHKCIFTQSNVLIIVTIVIKKSVYILSCLLHLYILSCLLNLYILSCLLPWSLRWLFKSDYFAVILKIQFI